MRTGAGQLVARVAGDVGSDVYDGVLVEGGSMWVHARRLCSGTGSPGNAAEVSSGSLVVEVTDDVYSPLDSALNCMGGTTLLRAARVHGLSPIVYVDSGVLELHGCTVAGTTSSGSVVAANRGRVVMRSCVVGGTANGDPTVRLESSSVLWLLGSRVFSAVGVESIGGDGSGIVDSAGSMASILPVDVSVRGSLQVGDAQPSPGSTPTATATGAWEWS